jgi:hypothetical protein
MSELPNDFTKLLRYIITAVKDYRCGDNCEPLEELVEEIIALQQAATIINKKELHRIANAAKLYIFHRRENARGEEGQMDRFDSYRLLCELVDKMPK